MLTPIIRSLIVSAAKRAATDPRIQRTAVEIARKAVPHVQAAARQVGAAAREAPPLRDPAGFARSVRDRISGKTR